MPNSVDVINEYFTAMADAQIAGELVSGFGAGASYPADGSNPGKVSMQFQRGYGPGSVTQLHIVAVVDRTGIPRLEARIFPHAPADVASGVAGRELDAWREELRSKYARIAFDA